jgi:DNA-binding PadR family transcriptional regulator
MPTETNGFLPLSPATLHILLSLAKRPLHGYAILQEVARQSESQYKMGPGTLYDNLQKMSDQGLIEEARRPEMQKDDPRRKYYQLTEFGRRVLESDICRLRNVVREAKLLTNKKLNLGSA